MQIEFPILLLLFILGASVGSFLNVVIYRVPKRMSIIAPRSHCFACKTPISFSDNIPILGYFILNGKCRNCKASFSMRYAAVEFLSAVLTCLMYVVFGLSSNFVIYVLISYCLIAISFIDLDHFIIPNGFIIIGLIGMAFVYSRNYMMQDWIDGATGSLIFGGFLFLIGVIGEFILKRESIGLGDVKLGLVLGGFLGSKLSILALYLSFGSAALMIMILVGMKKIDTSNKIPFGPYLSLGTFFTLISTTKSGDNFIINWYLHNMF